VTYPDSVRFLYALGNEIKSAKLGLERIRAVLEALGNPERAFRVVHVAGTNGKGSTCAMIEAGLRAEKGAANVPTGLFTSPHLIEPTERIQVDGIPVSPADFERAFNIVHETAEKLDLDCHPTYFETVTAMAFWLFREKHVQTAVIEVGLGGRLDSTNVVQPILTVITPIDFDHEAYLGHTIEAIAGEKAGILKPGVPAVFARQRPEALAVLLARAEQLQVPVTRAESFEIRDLHIDARGSRFSGLVCPLAGEHQVDNAVTAALVLRVLGVSPDGIKDAR
jgi:dihydrofolate synthase / folylpolyglutamate synthase